MTLEIPRLAGWLSAVFALTACFSEAGVPSSAAEHWAFQPVKMPAVPAVADTSHVQTLVDAFVVARLAERGLTFSPPADRATLVRRAYFNLVGVPPSADEVERLVSSPSPNAFAELVDRLLGDVRFGERWARYWLDVARYADSKGYVFQEERRYPYSYTYRDWVISAFNSDLPYDKFVLAQLAADQSLGKEEPRHLAAMGFLTLGRRFLNNEPDIIDDRIDVTFRGLQGLTVACARCHDHKFDPIPTADYYSIYGIFASSEEPNEKPLLGPAERTKEFLAFEAELKKRQQAADDFFAAKKRALFEPANVQKYLQLSADGWSKPDREFANLAKERQLYASAASRWREYWQKAGEKHPITGPWLAMRKVPPASIANERDRVLADSVTAGAINPLLADALKKAELTSMADVNKIYAELLAKHLGEKPMPDAEAEALRQFVMSREGIEGLEPRKLMRDFSVAEKETARKLRSEVESLRATSENSPPRGMVVVDKSQANDAHIFVRGNARSTGAKVPRQFLGCLSSDRKPFERGSGRLELAQSIASADNPLTARVFVNRVWGWLTGKPLVDTPSDFGVRTEPPANPELLEYLAASFIESGWSVKQLIHQIVLSSTWQQSSDQDDNPHSALRTPQSTDPDNDLQSRANRRRRDFESFRDSLLAVSGRLDRRIGGRPVSIDDAAATRRTIYGFIDRQNLPSLFRAFDFASPDQHSPKRFETTVPQQALFALNNPFVLEQAKALAGSVRGSAEERVEMLYRRVFSRPPEHAELKSSLAFVSAGPHGQSAGAWQYGWGNVDGSKAVEFHRLPHYGGERWSGSEQLPDPQLGWVMITRDGGHPGNREHAAIYRWEVPEKVTVDLRGEIKRGAGAGDGVRVRAVSSSRGLVGDWDVPAGGVANLSVDALELEVADALDFVIDCKVEEGSDSFQFEVKLVDTMSGKIVASTSRDFAGRALDPWVALAQVLLVSNEFTFVD